MTAPAPTLRLLSLGAGVQSTALAVMAARGELDPLDGAIFADPGWEPAAVYTHLDRLEGTLTEAGIPLYRVSNGNLRTDSVDPAHRFASVPYFLKFPEHQVPAASTACPAGCGWVAERHHDWVTAPAPAACATCSSTGTVVTAWRPATDAERLGMGRRQCTSEYKLAPIMRKVRELLGAPAPDYRRVPRGRVAEQWVGFSTDEVGRVGGGRGVLYERKRYPLLELDMSRTDCERYLRAHGWGDTTKSACIGCPFHGNRAWRELRDQRPDEWADAVEFDHALRARHVGTDLRGVPFLHRSAVPLDLAPIDRVTRGEWRDRQGDLFELAADDVVDAALEDGDPDGCSPYGCRSGGAVA